MKILKNIIALLSTLLFLWLGGFALFATFALFAKPQSPKISTEAIVVLTGGGQRIDEGLTLFAKKHSKNLFISGVDKNVIKSDITSRWHNAPLPPCCITLGYKATTTEENAIETQEWISENKIKSVRLVTGNYHIARALLEFHHMIPGVTIYAHPVQQPELTLENQIFWRLLILEYHKTIYRALQLTFNDTAKT